VSLYLNDIPLSSRSAHLLFTTARHLMSRSLLAEPLEGLPYFYRPYYAAQTWNGPDFGKTPNDVWIYGDAQDTASVFKSRQP